MPAGGGGPRGRAPGAGGGGSGAAGGGSKCGVGWAVSNRMQKVAVVEHLADFVVGGESYLPVLPVDVIVVVLDHIDSGGISERLRVSGPFGFDHIKGDSDGIRV